MQHDNAIFASDSKKNASFASRRVAQKRAFAWRGGAAARCLASIAAIALCIAPVSAASYNFDSDADPSNGATDGGGSWNTTLVNWYNGTTDVVWPNLVTDTAIFGNGGAGGTVAVIFPAVSAPPVIKVGTIQFNPTVTTTYTINGGPITLGTGIVNNNGTNNQTITSVLVGTNGLSFTGTGTGTVTLSGANTYTGITTLTSGGSLAMANATAFGSTASSSASTLGTDYTLVNAGATAKPATTAEAFLINGTGVAGTGALRIANANTTLSGFIQLASNSLISGAFSSGDNFAGNIDLQTFTLSTSNTNGTINGLITGTGSAGGLAIGNNSSFNLTNNGNTYSGTTSNGNGVLGLGGDLVLGSSKLALAGTVESTDSTARTIANPLSTNNTTFGATTVATGTLTFTNTTPTVLGNAASKTFTTNVDTTFLTPFSGGTGAPFTKAGAAKLTFTGTDTFLGGTTISAGILQLGNGGTTGSLSAASTTTTPTNTIVDNANFTINRSNAVTQGTDFTAAPITGSGTVTQAGTGLTTLGTTNSYTGGTAVTGGTISGGTASFGSGAITTTTPGVVDYTQGGPGTANNNITGTGKVTFGNTASSPNGNGGTITYAAVDSASGGTTVNSGTVLLSHGGGAITGPVAAATGGTLGLGNDNEIAASSNVTLLGGSLAANGHNEGSAGTPGLGTLQVGDPAAVATDSTLDFGDADGTNANTLAFSDSSTLSWNGTVTLTNYTDGADKLYIGTTNDLTATQLADIKFSGFLAGQDSTGKITFTPAPEPSGWASMIVGMSVLGGVMARRRKAV